MATILEKPSVTTIGSLWLEENQNKDFDSTASTSQRIGKYAGTVKGFAREVEVMYKTAKLTNQILKDAHIPPSPVLENFENNLGVVGGVFTVTGLYSMAADAVESISKLNKEDGVEFSRKAIKAIKETAGMLSAYSYAAHFIKADPVIANFGKTVGMVGNIAELEMAVVDYQSACQLESAAKNAPEEVKEAIAHSKKDQFIRLVRIVIVVASALLGLIAASWGMILPATGLILLSLTTTLLAIQRDLLKTSGKYKLIDFDREVRV